MRLIIFIIIQHFWKSPIQVSNNKIYGFCGLDLCSAVLENNQIWWWIWHLQDDTAFHSIDQSNASCSWYIGAPHQCSVWETCYRCL